ncbi:transposase [Alkalihalobacillus sp. BA299]|uniref:transposase n=1 Tax=Alkalihalobacillus sp. BA299 TaxID=2815938 RepID=UPI001ADD4B2E|nr:transposase [Alkalihalobacillus sp. BA299]
MGYELPFKWNGKQNGKEYRRYTCEACDICGQKESCTSAKGGRAVTRLKDEEAIEQIAKNTCNQSDIYKQRAAIVEHPFGTMKRGELKQFHGLDRAKRVRSKKHGYTSQIDCISGKLKEDTTILSSLSITYYPFLFSILVIFIKNSYDTKKQLKIS